MESGGVLEQLKAVDLSSIDRLIAIADERKRIEEYRARAEEKKGDVAEAVFARVMEDYAKRAAALETQSTPLKTQAAQEYRKLKAIVETLARGREQAQLQKDELQFRHSVGELTDAQIAEKLAEPQRALDECDRQHQEIDAVRGRFVAAFGGEQALDAAGTAPPPAPAAAAPPVSTASAASPPAPATPARSEPVVHAAPLPGVAVDEAVTRIAKAVRAASSPMSVPEPMVHPMPRLVPTAPARPEPVAAGARPEVARGSVVKVVETSSEPDALEGATLMLPTAALVLIEASGSRKEFPLSVFNEIGRGEENRIHVPHPGISRKHALIKAASGGFVISDMGSQNGTFVNGERIVERRLANGDSIDLGGVKLVFHTPWPQK